MVVSFKYLPIISGIFKGDCFTMFCRSTLYNSQWTIPHAHVQWNSILWNTDVKRFGCRFWKGSDYGSKCCGVFKRFQWFRFLRGSIYGSTGCGVFKRGVQSSNSSVFCERFWFAKPKKTLTVNDFFFTHQNSFLNDQDLSM